MGSCIRPAEDVADDDAAGGEGVANQRPVASPWDRLRAHDRRRPLRREREEGVERGIEHRRLHVVGEPSKRRVPPSPIGRRACTRVAASAEMRHVPVIDSAVAQGFAERIFVELRVVPRARDCPHVDHLLNAVCAKNGDEFFEFVRRVTDGECRHASGRCPVPTLDGPRLYSYYLLPTTCGRASCERPVHHGGVA